MVYVDYAKESFAIGRIRLVDSLVRHIYIQMTQRLDQLCNLSSFAVVFALVRCSRDLRCNGYKVERLVVDCIRSTVLLVMRPPSTLGVEAIKETVQSFFKIIILRQFTQVCRLYVAPS